jgi:hypothetical protein
MKRVAFKKGSALHSVSLLRHSRSPKFKRSVPDEVKCEPRKTQKDWEAEYREQWHNDLPYQRCAMTGKVMHKDNMQRHHVARRRGNRILIYCYLQAWAHWNIEHHAKAARKTGWLRNIGEGYPIDPEQPRPWIAGTLIGEKILDQIEGRVS